MISDLDNWTIANFKILDDYVIEIIFKNGKKQKIDFESVIGKSWMQQLKDPDYFKRVKLNDGGNLEWPNGQDFNPEALYDWPKFKQSYIDDMRRNS